MKCRKCAQEMSDDSKFCANCGQRVEESVLEIADRGMDITRKFWYLVGLMRGKGVVNGKKEDWFKEFEKIMLKYDSEIYETYEATIKYWEEFAEKNGKQKLSHTSSDRNELKE